MTKKKKIIIITIVGLLFLSFVIFVLSFILGFLEDKDQTRKEMKKIQKEYTSFKSSIESYNTARDRVYQEIFDVLYFDTMEVTDASNRKILEETEAIVQNVSKTSSSLKKACEGVIYPDASINTKCSSFALAYEQVVNSYVSDIENFNEQIKKYNEWAAPQQRQQLSSYQTKLKYIDYNKDKEYSGKEVQDGKE